MLTVQTYLALSAVHGIGLFAAEKIPAHSTVWQFNKHIDKMYTHATFFKMCHGLDSFALKHLLNASYCRGRRYYYLTDKARFINHSDDQYNIVFSGDDAEITLRDINVHEELLENYHLSYDLEDFFFQELTNPDPHIYVLNHAMEKGTVRYSL